MPLPLPNLDDRTYADLFEEARALIPGLDRAGADGTPSWSNHNPTDPGITLVELFAWLTELLIYRLNRVTDRQTIVFLRLLNGPTWTPTRPLAEEIRETVLKLRRTDRAVTGADYEQLARAVTPEVARARCIPRLNLESQLEAERLKPQAGHVSVVIVPNLPSELAPQPSPALLQDVWQALDPWRVLTTRHHVVGPVYAPVSVELLIARRPDWVLPVPLHLLGEDADTDANGVLRNNVVRGLERFLSPLAGGQDGAGWPFGRSVYVSELYALLQAIPGVDHVPDIRLSSPSQAGVPRCVPATDRWHPDGDQIGLDLAPHQLPWALIDPASIVVSPTFVAAQVLAHIVPADGADPATVNRAVKQAIRDGFHPLHGDPNFSAARTISQRDVERWVRNMPAHALIAYVQIELQSDPGHLQDDSAHPGEYQLSLGPGELADVHVTVKHEVPS